MLCGRLALNERATLRFLTTVQTLQDRHTQDGPGRARVESRQEGTRVKAQLGQGLANPDQDLEFATYCAQTIFCCKTLALVIEYDLGRVSPRCHSSQVGPQYDLSRVRP